MVEVDRSDNIEESILKSLSSIKLSNSFIKDTIEEKDENWINSGEYGDLSTRSLQILLETNELSIVSEGSLAAYTNDLLEFSDRPTSTDHVANSIHVSIRVLDSIGDKEATNCLLSKIQIDQSKHNHKIVSPAHIIHAYCSHTDHLSIVHGYYANSCAYIAANKEMDHFYALLQSYSSDNEYIIADYSIHRYSTHEEKIKLSSLVIIYSVIYLDENKRSIPKRIASASASKSSVIDDLIKMSAISSAGIPVSDFIPSFNSLEEATKNDQTIAIYFDDFQNIVGYRILNKISSIISDPNEGNCISFTKIGLFILRGTQKKIRNASDSVIKESSNGVQKSIKSYSIDIFNKVCTYLMDKFKERNSTFNINFGDPISAMNFVTKMLYGKSPNETQAAFAQSAIFKIDSNFKNQSRVFFLSTPPGSGKTACEIMPAVLERFRQIDSKIGDEKGSVIIATSLVQVSAQIATFASKMICSSEKWIRVKRLDGGIKEQTEDGYHSNMLFRKKSFRENIANIKWFYKQLVDDENIPSIVQDLMKKFNVSENKEIENEITSVFEDENLFRKKVFSEVLDGFDSESQCIADCIVGTYEMVASALSYSISTGKSQDIIRKIKYIIIDEWDTIFRVATMNNNRTLMQTMNQRFSQSYCLIALAILIMKVNPSTKLILASGTGNEMLNKCEDNFRTGKQSNMLEPLMRPIISYCDYESIIKKIEELSNDKNNAAANFSLNIMRNKIKTIEEFMKESIPRMIKISSSNIWGTRKLSSLPKSVLSTVMQAYTMVNYIFCEKCMNSGVIRASYALKSTTTNDHVMHTIMHLTALFLIDMNIAETIKMLAKYPSMQSWMFMISVIICVLTHENMSFSEKTSLIFIQKKELHIGMMILIGTILLILKKEGKIDAEFLSNRSPPDNEILETIAAISAKPIKFVDKCSSIAQTSKSYSIDHIVHKSELTKENYVKIKQITSIDEVDYAAYAISKDLLKLNFDIDHIWNLCELCVANGIISITRETVSQESMNKYIGNQDNNRIPLIAICTSRLGEGVDLVNVGSVFVMAQNHSLGIPTSRDCEQWIGRGYRNSHLSLGCPINNPAYEDYRSYCADDQNKFQFSHTAVYSGFLSTQVARRIISIDAFSPIIKKQNGSLYLMDFLPKSFSELNISYYSPLILDHLQDVDGSPNMKSIISSIELMTIPAKMVIRKTNMFTLTVRDITQYIPDLVITETLSIACNVWPIFVSSMYVALVRNCHFEESNSFPLIQFTKSVASCMSILSPKSQESEEYKLWNNIYESLKSPDINAASQLLSKLGLKMPDIFEYRTISQFSFTIGSKIANYSGIASLYFIFIIGVLSTDTNIDVFGPNPEGFEKKDIFVIDEAASNIIANNMMLVFDLIVTFGFGMNLTNLGISKCQRTKYPRIYESSNIHVSPCSCRPSLYYMCKEYNPFMMRTGANDEIIMNCEKEEDVFKCFSSCFNALLSLNEEYDSLFIHFTDDENWTQYSTKFSNLMELLIKRTKTSHDPRLEVFSDGMRKLNDIYENLKIHSDQLSEAMSPFISLINGFCSNFLPQFSTESYNDDEIAENFKRFVLVALNDIGINNIEEIIVLSKKTSN
ncbi:hypothetical protein TVAG_168400 [Trichomonas vaginalis G3]|uniref:Helicase conserved C-terminal domain containing protein n=2 Tax=Trichomonas vaginalis (strain ATCC PRA-98 / G3) TaxID=412133 RepID=A2F2E3_TRIV3|nr:hypothetical protein TVAG_168400 [Trichomonas vaginalis G3]|eukprot:XP_001313838.1 hypothetical protein [Trichomonas vaginalis G3]